MTTVTGLNGGFCEVSEAPADTDYLWSPTYEDLLQRQQTTQQT